MAADVIIRKQKISIRTGDAATAMQVRRQLNDALQYDIVKMLESVFEGQASPDTFINLGNIKIDLGKLGLNEVGASFVEMAKPALVKELQRLLQSSPDFWEPENSNSKGFYTREDKPDAQVQATSPNQQRLQALYYFLKHGIYPWWYQQGLRQTPTQMLEGLDDTGLQSLVLKILSGFNAGAAHHFTGRFFIHLPAEKHAVVLNALLGLLNNTALTTSARSLVKDIAQLKQMFGVSDSRFYTLLFNTIIEKRNDRKPALILDFLQRLMDVQNISIEKLRQQFSQNKEGEENTEKRRAKTWAVEGVGQDLADAFSIFLSDAGKAQRQGDDSKAVGATEENNPNAVNTVPHKLLETAASEGVYIGNAGLVLLHPFLQHLFAACSLLDGQQAFVNDAAQHKAAVLMYYLQCGSTAYQEWDMLLNKVCCGMATEEVLPADIIISEEEKIACDELLQAVVGYWEALRGASNEALQTTFIQRPGKLGWKQDSWLLQVERTGTDILLDRLPWGYSTIRLPWCGYLIYTEW